MNTEADLIRELVEAALRYGSAEARAAYLDGACPIDLRIRAKVEARLRESAEGPTEPQAGLGPMPDLGRVLLPVTEAPGDRIGRYRLIQKIGEGGFGVVYMADQEQPVQRRVALKVVKLGMDTQSVVARFEAERQALALMDHPGIARVFDGGATATGRPYFVMELVKGVRITEYCDHNQLPTRERLELYMQVCHAIQHAHQKGIIHRDIKPSNILVTAQKERPEPKVIDFGIAKAIDRRLTDQTLVTELGHFIGTPAYVSPEQAEMSGLDIDTRSDIYSLGVLLYELLTGQTPFDCKSLKAARIDALRRQIREEEPLRPSTRLTKLAAAELDKVARDHRSVPGKLHQALRGDLDWIVMKALEKDRTHRYASANELAADIARHLNNEPVTAAAPSVGYRLKKFVRRNRMGLGMAAAVTAALVLGAVGSIWQAVRADANRRKAEVAERAAVTNQLEAEKLITFMLDDLGTALQPFARLDLMEPVIERAAEFYRKRAPSDGSTDSEFNRSLSLMHLGRVHFNRAEDPAAESNFLAALKIQEQLLERIPDSLPWGLALAGTESWLSSLYGRRRDELQWISHAERGHRLLTELAARWPDNLLVQNHLGMSHCGLGGGLTRDTDPAAALRKFEHCSQAIAIFCALTNREPSNKLWQAQLGFCYDQLGAQYYSRQVERHKGLEAFGAASTLFSNLVRNASQNLLWKQRLAFALWQRGRVELEISLLDEAERHSLAAVSLFEELVREDNLSLRACEQGLGQAKQVLGRIYLSRQDPLRAKPLLLDALRTFTRLAMKSRDDRLWADLESETFRYYRLACYKLIIGHGETEPEAIQKLYLELAQNIFQRQAVWDVPHPVRHLMSTFGDLYTGLELRGSDGVANVTSSEPPLPRGIITQMNKAPRVPRILLSTNTIWKHQSDDPMVGTNWMHPGGTDELGWREGPAPLGFGENFLATQIEAGPPPIPITTYFRTRFQAKDAGGLSNLWLRVLVDDGALFYLNGKEVFRFNMSGGPVDPLTVARVALEIMGGYIDYLIVLDAPLQETNLLAVEVHQSESSSSDLVFGMELRTVPADMAESFSTELAQDRAAFVLAAAYLTRELQRAEATSSMAFWVPADYRQMAAQLPHVAPALRAPTMVIPEGSAWKYLDKGVDQGAVWTRTDFDDRDWKEGTAPLGYPSARVATLVDYGGIPRRKHPTLYLRKTLILDPGQVQGAWLMRLLIDDGAVVYWNGQEVLRHNMSSGPVNFLSQASLSGNMTDFISFVLPSLPVTQRTNVLAVEVHQRGLDSVDCAFDAELVVGVPSLDTVLAGANVREIRQYLADQNFPMPEDLLRLRGQHSWRSSR